MRILIKSILIFTFTAWVPLAAQEENGEGEKPGWAELTEGLEGRDGLLTTYLDADEGRVLMALPAPDRDGVSARFVYAEYLRGGLGSNPVGLDRSQPGQTDVVALRRVGKKVFFEAENWRYRAGTNNPDERRAVADSFARSFLWATEILAEHEDGRLLIDVSGFLTRDAHLVAERLEGSGQGSFSLNQDLSAVDVGTSLVFPDNIELEAYLTFTGTNPGSEVRNVAPNARSLTLVQHHSFVRLPDDGYRMRAGDERAAVISMDVYDYAASLSDPIIRNVAVRHRLQKTAPGAAPSTVVEPIVYYVDSGAPEPVKSALIEGAQWWADAFEAAGFIDAFRVEELPEGAHPLDVRYNMINWVHRQTRGWSYGASIVDPRTGEIIKGNVLLGSLRVRQDRMIFEGLVGADETGSGGPNDPLRAALARIRQLSAHEVGHTLGFQHNMAASTQDRASVMDYPAPHIEIDGGGLSLANAYDTGMGEWDILTVRYLYSEFDEGTDERAALNAILEEGYEDQGLIYVADRHSRPPGAPHPLGNLWDTGSDPVAELQRMLDVRRIALDGFGRRSIPDGAPLSRLHQNIVPIYLLHRYQIEAAAKSLGGMDFQYATRDGFLGGPEIVPAERQREALDSLLRAVEPATLDLSDDLLGLMVPPESGFDGQARREVFPSASGAAFSLLDAADVAAGLVIDTILHPQRLSRLEEFHARNARLPNAAEVIATLSEHVFRAPRNEGPRHTLIRNTVKTRLVSALIETAMGASPGGPDIPGFSQDRGREALNANAQAAVEAALRLLHDRLSGRTAGETDAMLARRIEAYLNRPASPAHPTLPGPSTPPGSPIGQGEGEVCWMCDMPIGDGN